jgi:hypothetical protein
MAWRGGNCTLAYSVSVGERRNGRLGHGDDSSYQRAALGLGTDKPKFGRWLPGYFFICVKVIRNDRWSRYDFLLILLANRFNSAYYLLLNTGKWSGGETSKRLTSLLGVVETRQIVGLRKFPQRMHTAVGG